MDKSETVFEDDVISDERVEADGEDAYEHDENRMRSDGLGDDEIRIWKMLQQKLQCSH